MFPFLSRLITKSKGKTYIYITICTTFSMYIQMISIFSLVLGHQKVYKYPLMWTIIFIICKHSVPIKVKRKIK